MCSADRDGDEVRHHKRPGSELGGHGTLGPPTAHEGADDGVGPTPHPIRSRTAGLASVLPHDNTAFSPLPCPAAGRGGTCGVLSWNSHGLSLHALEGTPAERSKWRKAKAIKKLAAGRVACLQETRALRYEDDAFDSALPDHLVIYGNGVSRAKAGVITALPNRLLEAYTPKVFELPENIAGHLLVVGLADKRTGLVDLVYCNVYLPAQNDHLKLPCLQALLTLPVGPRYVMAGDWNFTEKVEDGSHRLASVPAGVWTAVKNRFGLAEHDQPSSTYFGADSVNSRVDRVYSTHNDLDHVLTNPACFVSLRPETSGARDPPASTSIYDHHPLTCDFLSTEPRKHRDYNVPAWLFSHRDFTTELRNNLSRFSDSAESDNPFDDMTLFKKIIVDSSKAFFRKQTKVKVETQERAAKVSILVRLLRECTRDEVDHAKVQDMEGRYEGVGLLIERSGTSYDVARLRDRITSLLAEGVVNKAADAVSRAKRQAPNSDAKTTFPSLSPTLTLQAKAPLGPSWRPRW